MRSRRLALQLLWQAVCCTQGTTIDAQMAEAIQCNVLDMYCRQLLCTVVEYSLTLLLKSDD